MNASGSQPAAETVTVSAINTTNTTLGAPQCFVDIYPFEGGPYSFKGGSVLRCITQKDIKIVDGNFTIILAPSSPPKSSLSWGQILTPMSFVVIGMTRAGLSAITMVGVITQVQEDQAWRFGNPTTRTVTVTGKDVGYFFTFYDYYTLFLLATQSDLSKGFGALALGEFQGDPGDVANKWYNQVMVGTQKTPGVFLNMGVPYNLGATDSDTGATPVGSSSNSTTPTTNKVLLSDLFGTRFDNYGVVLPFADYFIGVNGPWADKFKVILPFPFYEFFVTTASNNAYNSGSGETVTSGTKITSSGLDQSITATPMIVGRKNPVPLLVTTVQGSTPQSSPVKFESIDVSAWNALPEYNPLDLNFIENSIRFSESQVYNFYNINFPYMLGLQGGGNDNYNIPMYNFAATADKASVNRYGYRPLELSINWFADPKGTFSQTQSNPGQTVLQVYSTLIGQAAGYYEAMPLMAEADIRLPLRPDIQIGCVFTYQPFRTSGLDDEGFWNFYIEGVVHEYVFGQQSSTRLRLTRGLPSSVYQDSGTGGVLFAIHTGNAQRIGGQYQVGLPPGSASSLASLSINQFTQWLFQPLQQYNTAQHVAPPSP